MTSKLQIKCIGFTLGSALMLCASVAFAATPADDSAAQSTQVALATTPAAAQDAASSDAVPTKGPGEARARAAAAEGNEALRRYIWRTRMIYNFSFWDFAKEE